MPVIGREGRMGIFARAHRALTGDPHRVIGRAAGAANRSRLVGAVFRKSRAQMLEESKAKSSKGIPTRKAVGKK